MKNLSYQEQSSLSLSHGDILPGSVLATTTLSGIIYQAASQDRGIIHCFQDRLRLRDRNYTEDFQSYKVLLAEAECILGALRLHGLKPLDQVILQFQHPRYFFAALWGCFLGGFVPIPLGVDLNRHSSRLLQAWKLCNSPLIVTESDFEGAIKDLAQDLSVIGVEKLLDNQPDSNWHCGKLDDLALLLFTSGSTGKPKGVMLSTRNLLASVYGMAKVNRLDQEDISLNWMPLEHVASLVMFHLTQVYLGCQQIQVKSEFILQNPLLWLDLIDRYRVTTTWSPNFAYNLVNEKLENSLQQDWDLSCVGWMGNGAEAVVGQTTRRFLELLAPYGLAPTVVSPGYGMSETSSGISHCDSFNLNMNQEFVEVGAPIPGISLRIVDQENRVIPEGEVGLLQVRGETVTAGYYQQPELNQEIFTRDGWFNTGDLGFLKHGRLTITGRQKDVIIINGVNYYNHEIETVVETIPGVTISYTAACGVKDSKQQEKLAIFFHSPEEEDDKLRELVNSIRTQVFNQIGVAPTYIIPVAKEIIPKTAIGKIQRQQLSERFALGEFDSVIEKIGELFNKRNLTQQELPHNAIEQRLVEVWGEVLNLETVGIKDNFFELGGNSLLLMEVLNKLTREYNTFTLSAVTLFQYPTITALASYLDTDQESVAVQQGKRRGELRQKKTGNQDIAIIGMSCRFPGASNIEEFWHNLCNGVESISFFSDQDILDSGVDAELVDNPNYVKASPTLDNIEDFDAEFWGYSPKEAQLLDPQQRLFLECAWESLEDAGYDPFNYQGDIGLYGGAATNTYLLNHIYPNRHTIDDRDSLQVMNLSTMGGFQVTVANDKDYLSTRTSYKLNLTGSSVNVQTACSTSLVTVHLACQSLLNSECDIALAGGVSIHTPQKMGYLYQEGMILSPDGHCRAFDAQAGGTIFGSGAGMVVLKLLDQAIEDRDRIYGVIKGSAVNNDGGTKVGYLAPNVDGQARVVAEALAVADIPPHSISYIEAHGTGTKLGDPIEIAALTQAFQDNNRDTGYCAVGSVKSNLGHLQMASGIVGLIKTCLCLYHRKIPASLHFTEPNPQIDFDHSPFYVNTQLQDWKASVYRRRAGVNSLGIGGTNAHLVLEEFITKRETGINKLPAYLFTLSAKNKTALTGLIESYQDYLIEHPEVDFADICFTSNIGRHHFEYRQVIVARNKLELAEKLPEISNLNSVRQHNKKIAFLFTGQGSQYVNMGCQLYQTQPVFKRGINKCAKILESYLDQPLIDLLFPNTSSIIVPHSLLLDEIEYTQPLLFAIEYSLAQLWLSWGIKPDVVMGHSLGEYVAACLAGVFSLEDGLKLVATRGKLMQNLPKNGAMIAVFSKQEKIDFLLDKNISIAAYNGSHLVLSGLEDDIDNIASKLDEVGIKIKYLKVSHGFHSPLMQPILEDFQGVAETINYSLPKIPIVSNLTGKLADDTIATADYWIDHVLQPVQFAKSIEFLDRQQVNIFLEIGTKPTLTEIVTGILDNKLFLHSLNPKQPDWQQILDTLGQLYIQGININWSQVTQNYSSQKISLPTYPFQRKRYWFDLPQEVTTTQFIQKGDRFHPLLGKPLSSPLKQTIFQSHLQPDTITWLQDHCLEDKPVFPGTAYLEMAIASGIFYYKTDQLTIENVIINSPLILGNDVAIIPEIQLILTPSQESATWEVYSLDNNQWQLHTSGQVCPLNQTAENINLESLKAKFQDTELDIKQHYQQWKQRGINYGASFQGIKQLWVKDKEALGLIELPPNLTNNSQEYYLHPALLDSCLQILLAALPAELQTTTYIPVALDKLNIYNLPGNKIWSHLKLKPDNSSQDKIIIADVWLYSDRNDLIAKIEGLKSQAVNSQPPWHNWLYRQQWQPQPLLKKSSLSNKTGTWLIFADNRGIGKEITTLLASQQQQYCLVTRDNINPHNPEAFQQLIQQQSDIKGVIYLWSLDPSEDWQECKNYLYLVQALIQQGYNSPLWFVTRNAQPVHNYQMTSGIKQSCLWGMQKAIALEHPELSWIGVDLDLNPTDGEAENIFREVCASHIEQVAFRNNQRYISRLVRASFNSQPKLKAATRKENLQLQINHGGNLDSLQWQSTLRHQPKDQEIEIEVKATGLNFRDLMVSLNLYPDDCQFLGLECSGIVTKIGKKVRNFKIGDEVIAISSHSFSKYLTVNSLLGIPKPKCLSFEQATTIPVTFLTAYYTLSHLANLQPGEKILIHSAAGGVGLAAIQIAQEIGAEIFATASPTKWELLKSLGVNNIMNSRSLDFATEIISATQGKGVDVVLNSLSGEFIAKSISVLNHQGRFIEIGKQGIWSRSDVAKIKPSINYFIVDLWQITQDKPALIQKMLSKLLRKFTTGKLKPLPYTLFTRDKTLDAFRYMQQGKHQGKIIITPSTSHNSETPPVFPITFNGTYLITGGLGAIGLQVAAWLANQGIKHLVLLGRNNIKPELQDNLKKLQDSTHATLIKADVADTDQLAQALSQIKSPLPPLKGVVHCAGVLDDRLICQQDWGSFTKVLASKVQGAWNLHHLTQKYDLESFILFSSASSLLGAAGQSNYCAANTFLDTLAHGRRNQGLPAISINWGAWQNTGLASKTQTMASLKQKGIGTINPKQGIEILEQLLLHSPVQIGVIPIDWHVWSKNNNPTSFYHNLIPNQPLSKTITDFQQQLITAQTSQRKSILIKQISHHVASILGIKDIKTIDLNSGFSELGIDSLGSVELRNKIQSSYDLKLSPTIIFDYSNIKVMSDYLLSLLFKINPYKTNETIQKNDYLISLENLSEAEAEALLLEELKDFKF